MTATIGTLIDQLATLQPDWHFLLASGYSKHHESDGQDYFCHLMDPTFSTTMHQKDSQHVFAFANTAFDAFDRALEKLIARQS